MKLSVLYLIKFGSTTNMITHVGTSQVLKPFTLVSSRILSQESSIAYCQAISPESANQCSRFKRQYLLVSLRSTSSCLRLLPLLFVSFIFPSVTYFRRQSPIRFASTPINLLYAGSIFHRRIVVILFMVLQYKLGLSPIIVEVSRSHKIRHTHTHTHGRSCMNWRLARLRGRYLHNTPKRGTYVPSADFEPAVPAIQRPQTYTFDLTVTGIGATSSFFTRSVQVIFSFLRQPCSNK